jgi:hypothetical protein
MENTLAVVCVLLGGVLVLMPVLFLIPPVGVAWV